MSQPRWRCAAASLSLTLGTPDPLRGVFLPLRPVAGQAARFAAPASTKMGPRRAPMRAVRFEGGAVRLVDAPPVGGGGVRVRIGGCGICGSDLAMLDSGFPLAGIPGHELAGELDDGTPVAIEPLAPCGSCEFCARGDYQVCRAGISMIYGVGRDGGMAEEVRVPERAIVRRPRQVRVEDACLVEPLAVALHGMRRAGLRGDERVCVVGGGPIGLCAVAASVAAGCETALVARHPAQIAA